MSRRVVSALLSVIENPIRRIVGGRSETDDVTDDDDAPQSADSGEIRAVYREAADSPIAGGRWEVLADDTVQYVRPSGEIVRPAVVSAATLRDSPTWRRAN